jgi:hypothetical protein
MITKPLNNIQIGKIIIGNSKNKPLGVFRQWKEVIVDDFSPTPIIVYGELWLDENRDYADPEMELIFRLHARMATWRNSQVKIDHIELTYRPFTYDKLYINYGKQTIRPANIGFVVAQCNKILQRIGESNPSTTRSK